ncbi:MAG: acyltransferase family protein [Bacteroidaceae bacterium]|nr:acyltransferase family protein [Bacteroidaceae bacterium]
MNIATASEKEPLTQRGRTGGGLRNHAFDLLCGLCILRMVTLHVVCQTTLRQADWWKVIMEWSFYLMSFFFFKAGYFNKGVQGNSRTYCWDKFRRLMIPYFSWAAISACVCLFFMLAFPGRFPGTEHSFHHFRLWVGGFTWGNSPLWFLPCFFTSYIIVHFIEKVRHLHLVILFFPLLSYWLYKLGNPLYLMMNNVFCGAFFFYLGKVWHKTLDWTGDKKGLILSIVLIAAFVCVNIYLHGEYEMKTNTFTGPFWQVMLNTILALLGLSGLPLTMHIRRIPGICHIGEHSMVYFVAHYPLIMCYVYIATLAGHNIKKSVPDMFLMTILVFIICTLLVPLVERVFWLSGKSLPQPLRKKDEQTGRPVVYFYHTQDTVRIVREWKEGIFPAHFLYGALQLEQYGFDIIWHDQIHLYKRVRDTLKATWKILTCRKPYDILYATHTRGIEPIILLHAIGLYRKPIVVWHHQPIVKAKNRLREALARLFYRGMDHMIFFSEKLIQDSLKSAKADPTRMSMVHWGADLAFYDSLSRSLQKRSGNPSGETSSILTSNGGAGGSFISTGKELRDYKTLTEAFNNTGLPLILFTQKQQEGLFTNLKRRENIDLRFGERLMPYEIALLVAQSQCVCICCKQSNYTVGLTTVVEAMALGLPILCTRNPQMPMDLEAEGCGIYLEPYDREGWERAIRYIAEHPEEAKEMGRKGHLLAEKYYNVEQCAKEVAKIIKNEG